MLTLWHHIPAFSSFKASFNPNPNPNPNLQDSCVAEVLILKPRTSILLSSDPKHVQHPLSGQCCKLPSKTTEKDDEKIQEMTLSLGAERLAWMVDAAVAAGLSELDIILALKEERRTVLKVFQSGRIFSLYSQMASVGICLKIARHIISPLHY